MKASNEFVEPTDGWWKVPDADSLEILMADSQPQFGISINVDTGRNIILDLRHPPKIFVLPLGEFDSVENAKANLSAYLTV